MHGVKLETSLLLSLKSPKKKKKSQRGKNVASAPSFHLPATCILHLCFRWCMGYFHAAPRQHQPVLTSEALVLFPAPRISWFLDARGLSANTGCLWPPFSFWGCLALKQTSNPRSPTGLWKWVLLIKNTMHSGRFSFVRACLKRSTISRTLRGKGDGDAITCKGWDHS